MRLALLIVLLFALLYDRADSIHAAAFVKRFTDLPLAERVTTDARCDPSGVIAGTLRNDGDGWFALDDADHTPVNIASVETGLHSIRIRFAIKGRAVRTLIAAPDETLAASGFTSGASVGLNDAEIILGRSGLLGSRKVSPVFVDTSSYPWSNIWIYGVVDGAC